MKKFADRVQAECYSGQRYAEQPLAFVLQDMRYVVEKVQERWRSPDGPHFLVRTVDGRRFELAYDEVGDAWYLDQVV